MFTERAKMKEISEKKRFCFMRENIESTLMMKSTVVREKEKREKHTVVHCVLLMCYIRYCLWLWMKK